MGRAEVQLKELLFQKAWKRKPSVFLVLVIKKFLIKILFLLWLKAFDFSEGISQL